MARASEELIAELELLGYLDPSIESFLDPEPLKVVQVQKAGQDERFSPEYRQYMQSPEWRARKKRLSPGKRCGGCNTEIGLELHHRCYPPRGSSLQAFIDQPDSEFTWFCEDCHKAITTSMRRRRKKKT